MEGNSALSQLQNAALDCAGEVREKESITFYQEILTKEGSLLRQASTNSLNGLLKSPVKVGGLFLGMRNRTLIGCISEFGGSPFASSIAVMPNDQISA